MRILQVGVRLVRILGRQFRLGKLVLGIADGRVLADDRCVFVASEMRVPN